MTFLKTGFNGAAALQPRKAGRRRRPHAAGPAASMGPRLFSRGRGGLAVYKTSEWLASMGPRLFSRGRRHAETLYCGCVELQWGRGSSAAEGTRTLTGCSICRTLQWGRGSSAAEGTYRVHLRVRSAASMGPRLFSRGRMVRRRTAVSSPSSFNGAAALQPRKAMLARLRPAAPTGFNGAAALQPRKDTTLDPRTGEPKGFNGAAALQPRKVPIWWVTKPAIRCFNGAAALQPRKDVDDEWSLWDHLGFNGAAALQPRKVHPPLQTSCLVSQLQWGRGSSAAEGFLAGVADVLQVGFNGAAALQPRKARSSTSVADPLRASMGPRLFSRGRSIFITRSRARGQTIVREHPAGNARSASQHDLQQCHKSFLRQEL